jgi:hypothetical protein
MDTSETLREDIDGNLKSEVIVIGDENTSLQDSFAKFLKEKKQERRLQKLCSQERPSRPQEFKDKLRAKFLERAKTYIGIPYAQKYQPEDAPELPLYLDCCGLVRQVMKDLQDEFGFAMGKWNQVKSLSKYCVYLMVLCIIFCAGLSIRHPTDPCRLC